MLYNQNHKIAFIHSVSNSESYRNLCTIVFNLLEPYEVAWGADVCTKSTKELTPVLNQIMGVMRSGHVSKLTVLKKYFKYCIEVGYPGAGNGIDGVVISNVEKIKTEMVSGPIALQTYLDKVFVPESELTMSNIYRCFYWFSFSGINAEDIFRLKKENIDLIHAVAHLDGRTYRLYTESYPAIYNAITIESFQYRHEHYQTTVYKDRFPGDLIMRGLMNRPGRTQNTDPSVMMQNMKTAIYIATSKATYRGERVPILSISHTRLSGFFYRKYQLERVAGEPYTELDFLDIAEETMRESRSSKMTDSRMRAARKRVAKSLFADYESWKEAFNI